MKRLVSFSIVFLIVIGLVTVFVNADEFKYEDKIGVIKIKPDDSIHIVYWLAGQNAGEGWGLGEDSRRGVEIAIEDKGGKLLGHPVKLSGEESDCRAEGGQAAATKLASDPTIVAAIGPSCSSEAQTGAPILWKVGIVSVSPSATAPFLTDPKRGPDYEGYLRTCANDKVQGGVAAEFAFKELKVKKAATIHDGSPYSEQLQAVFAETFKKLGGTVTAQKAVSGKDVDMKPMLTEIGTGQAELIYYPVVVTAAGVLITRQAKDVAGLKKTYLMSSDGTFFPDFYKDAGEAAVGMFHSSPDYSGNKEFLERYEKKYGEKPMFPYHVHAYDAAMLIFAAIEKVAKESPDGTLYIGRQQLRDALYAAKGFKGLTGTLNCDEYGDCADPKIAVYKTTAENVKTLTLPTVPFWKPY